MKRALIPAILVATLVTLLAAAGTQRSDPKSTSAKPWTNVPTRVDAFHPDAQPGPDGAIPPQPKPAYGGRAILQMEGMPKSLCWPLESWSLVRRILYETHETLLLRNWETGVLEPDLCTDWVVEDALVKTGGRGERDANVLYGRVREDGDAYVVTPVAKENPLREETRVPKSAVERVERGSVFTFHLRDGVKWHDGHPFDARDVRFSFELYRNPQVKCDDKRFQFEKVVDCVEASPRALRFVYAHTYFNALSSLGDMAIVPSHLYDLDDPDVASFDPAIKARREKEPAWKPSLAEKATYIHENPRNKLWVGLGPYRVTAFGTDFIEAQRYDGYFDPDRGGYLDTIRWRAIPDNAVGFQALLNGEVDFFDWMTPEDYFGATVEKPVFKERFYKGLHDSPIYWYIGWNTLRPKLSDPAVRRALAHLFDFDEFARTFYRGLARQVTAHWIYDSPAYDHDVVPYPYDPKIARKMLADAGWYDRDGDGILDKDGEPFTIELMMLAGNASGQAFSAKLQENLAQSGIKLTIASMELNTLNDRKKKREFDAVALAWSPAYESDPEQVWHSRWGVKEATGGNHVGLQDKQTDALIERGQIELDTSKRNEIWHALHRRVYELQPYLFCYNVARRFALSRKLRGFQNVVIDPNYVVRRWYYPEGTPGTRATRRGE